MIRAIRPASILVLLAALAAPCAGADAQAPEPPVQTLETVDLGPGEEPWSGGTYDLDEGERKAAAAAVQGEGVGLTAYCTPRRTIPVMVAGAPRGVYPRFDGRVRQGLMRAGGAPDGGSDADIVMRFAGGQEYAVRARLHGLTGEVMLGDTPDGFAAYSPVLETLMAGESVTISAPPFSATFQLKGSRAAICGMLRRCGLASAQPGCP